MKPFDAYTIATVMVFRSRTVPVRCSDAAPQVVLLSSAPLLSIIPVIEALKMLKTGTSSMKIWARYPSAIRFNKSDLTCPPAHPTLVTVFMFSPHQRFQRRLSLQIPFPTETPARQIPFCSKKPPKMMPPHSTFPQHYHFTHHFRKMHEITLCKDQQCRQYIVRRQLATAPQSAHHMRANCIMTSALYCTSITDFRHPLRPGTSPQAGDAACISRGLC